MVIENTVMPKTNEESGPEASRKRFTLEFAPDAQERLTRIREMSGARTNAEVIRNGLRLFAWILEQQKAGYKIHLVKGKVAKEVELFFSS